MTSGISESVYKAAFAAADKAEGDNDSHVTTKKGLNAFHSYIYNYVKQNNPEMAYRGESRIDHQGENVRRVVRSAFGPNGEKLEADGFQGDISRGDWAKVFSTDGGIGKNFDIDFEKLNALLGGEAEQKPQTADQTQAPNAAAKAQAPEASTPPANAGLMVPETALKKDSTDYPDGYADAAVVQALLLQKVPGIVNSLRKYNDPGLMKREYNHTFKNDARVEIRDALGGAESVWQKRFVAYHDKMKQTERLINSQSHFEYLVEAMGEGKYKVNGKPVMPRALLEELKLIGAGETPAKAATPNAPPATANVSNRSTAASNAPGAPDQTSYPNP